MDCKYVYLKELNKLISPLNEEIKSEIYYDIIKLPDIYLPQIHELKYYFDGLNWKINKHLWKFILKELTSRIHEEIRNGEILKILQFIRDSNMKIKSFNVVRIPGYRKIIETNNQELSKSRICELRRLNKLQNHIINRIPNQIFKFASSQYFDPDKCNISTFTEILINHTN